MHLLKPAKSGTECEAPSLWTTMFDPAAFVCEMCGSISKGKKGRMGPLSRQQAFLFTGSV